MAKPYAYVCTACDHLASRHTLHPGAVSLDGFFSCRYNGCDCEILQASPMYGIDEGWFNREHLPTLEAYHFE